METIRGKQIQRKATNATVRGPDLAVCGTEKQEIGINGEKLRRPSSKNGMKKANEMRMVCHF